jgi:hypothetical protein
MGPTAIRMAGAWSTLAAFHVCIGAVILQPVATRQQNKRLAMMKTFKIEFMDIRICC